MVRNISCPDRRQKVVRSDESSHLGLCVSELLFIHSEGVGVDSSLVLVPCTLPSIDAFSIPCVVGERRVFHSRDYDGTDGVISCHLDLILGTEMEEPWSGVCVHSWYSGLDVL